RLAVSRRPVEEERCPGVDRRTELDQQGGTQGQVLERAGQPGRRHVRLAYLGADRLLVLGKGNRRRADVVVAGQDVASPQTTGVADQVTERLAEVVARRRPRHPPDGLDPALLDQALDGRGPRLGRQGGGRRPI